MKNQAILFILSIDFLSLLPLPAAAILSSRSSPAMSRHAPLNALIREIPWLRHMSTPFENTTLRVRGLPAFRQPVAGAG